MIPIGDRAAAWVDKYVRESRPRLVVEPDDRTVFLSNAGEPFCLEHLSNLVRAYVDKADIGKRGACHLFRHSMATLDAGKRRGHPVHPADARACGFEQHADLHARIDPEAEADPHGDTSGQAKTKSGHAGRSGTGKEMRSLFLAVTMPSGEQAGETAQWGTRDRRHL